MRDRSLYISLGHNSSATLAVDGAVTRGYEQERFDRKKSSSAYPVDAIEAALGTKNAGTVYVSHWFDHFENLSNKYLDMKHLKSRCDGAIVNLSRDFTHHDAHAHSVKTFAKGHGVAGPACIIVADGFGNLQECFSVYALDGGEARLVHRTYGYEHSLGLMYQYVTEFLGMRPNQDEYKLLGYEAHILRHVTLERATEIRHKIELEGIEFADAMMAAVAVPEPKISLIDVERLSSTRDMWFYKSRVWRSYFPDIFETESLRTCIAFCAQAFLEAAMTKLVWGFVPMGARRILLAGGVFYNVKLSRCLQVSTGLQVFTHPLAGDQGAALGMGPYPPALVTLKIGERLLPSDGSSKMIGLDDNSKMMGLDIVDDSRWPDFVSERVMQGEIVNVVRGAMEFGPRALCNTSTFALPTQENVLTINRLNERDTFMPMAPVMSETAARSLLDYDELFRVRHSARYMITTVKWSMPPPSSMMGVVHPDPLVPGLWTSRPQVVYPQTDPQLDALLSGVTSETLINTSFNYHGEPIVMTPYHALATHEKMRARNEALGLGAKITTVLVRS